MIQSSVCRSMWGERRHWHRQRSERFFVFSSLSPSESILGWNAALFWCPTRRQIHSWCQEWGRFINRAKNVNKKINLFALRRLQIRRERFGQRREHGSQTRIRRSMVKPTIVQQESRIKVWDKHSEHLQTNDERMKRKSRPKRCTINSFNDWKHSINNDNRSKIDNARRYSTNEWSRNAKRRRTKKQIKFPIKPTVPKIKLPNQRPGRSSRQKNEERSRLPMIFVHHHHDPASLSVARFNNKIE